MKRFLSIFAIMAMIVSMFSGVAFAAADEAYIELDETTLIYEEGFNTVTLSGQVFVASSNALADEDGTYQIIHVGETTEEAITIGSDDEFDFSNGEFSIQIPTYEYGVGNYRVEPVTTDYAYTDSSDHPYPTFVITYDMELETP